MMIGKVVQNSAFTHRILISLNIMKALLVMFYCLFVLLVSKVVLPGRKTKFQDMFFGSGRKVEASEQ